METKHFGAALELKTAAVGSQGSLSGYAAVFGNKDRNGDVIERGAFTKTLSTARERKAARRGAALFPMLWQHNTTEPIGGITSAVEDFTGLRIEAQLDLSAEAGRRAYSALKQGYLDSMSIGYHVRASLPKKDAQYLTEIDLLEVSLVTFPANVLALVGEVKSAHAWGQGKTAAQIQRDMEYQLLVLQIDAAIADLMRQEERRKRRGW